MTKKKKDFKQTKKASDSVECIEIKEYKEIRKLMDVIISENKEALKELAK